MAFSHAVSGLERIGLQPLRTLVPRFFSQSHRVDETKSARECKFNREFNLRRNGALKCAGAEARCLLASDGTAESRALLPAEAKACDAIQFALRAGFSGTREGFGVR